MNNIRSLFKKTIGKIIAVILNPYMLVVIFAILLMVAQNIIIGIGVAIFVFFVFYAILVSVRNAKKKKTYIICFVISIAIILLMSIFCIQKIPSLKHNFGSTKNISNRHDIEYCLDKGIKNTEMSPSTIEDTPYIETETINLRGQDNSSDGGRIRFYYSVVELQDVKLLFKHTTENLYVDKSIVVYLTKLDSNDMEVYNKILDKDIYKAIAVYDEERLNSDLLGWRLFTIGQFVVCLIAIFICFYIVFKYNERYFLFYVLSVKFKRLFKDRHTND